VFLSIEFFLIQQMNGAEKHSRVEDSNESKWDLVAFFKTDIQV